jgi:hypothetical protein
LRIDAAGRVLKIVFEEQVGSFSSREIDDLRRRIERMAFIPGMHQGKPVEMDYLLVYTRRQRNQNEFRPMHGT